MAEPPVRLVKLIGDAAMLVSTDTGAMVEAALRMVEAAEREGDDFPRLRAGIAHGSLHVQGGDYYGRPVNLASRLTAVARPGSVLLDRAAKELAGPRLRLLLRRRASPQGLRRPHQALPCPPRSRQIASRTEAPAVKRGANRPGSMPFTGYGR